jgi:hypothetical protein
MTKRKVGRPPGPGTRTTRPADEKNPGEGSHLGKVAADSPRAKLTDVIQTEVLEYLALGHTIGAICRRVGITMQALYKARSRDPDFDGAWREAVEMGVGRLEDVTLEKALGGDLGAIGMLLKARKPELYADRTKLDIGGTGQPVTLLGGSLTDYSDAERALAAQYMTALLTGEDVPELTHEQAQRIQALIPSLQRNRQLEQLSDDQLGQIIDDSDGGIDYSS